MSGLVEHILRKLNEHTEKWDDLPRVTVESAAVSDEQTAAWSESMYQRDMEIDRKDRGLALLAIFAIFGALLAAGVLTCGVVKADPVDDFVWQSAPSLCAALDKTPTTDELETLITAVWQKGYEPRLAGEIVGRAILGYCPRFMPVVKKFLAEHTVAAGIGGRLGA